MSLLDIHRLNVSFGESPILKDVSLHLDPGEVVGIAGESGSGKTMTALAVAGLLPDRAKQSGSIVLDGKDLSSATDAEYCKIRGQEIGVVFQEPMTALNPVMTIGDQVAETILIHTGCSRHDAQRKARETLAKVGLPESRFPSDRFPHNLSGGQRQRVAIAVAVVLKPKLLIADEPTTALDVSTQAEVLALFKALVAENESGLILVTHDLAVIAETANRVAIMKAGEIVEQGTVRTIFRNSKETYTRSLLANTQHVPTRAARRKLGQEPVLETRNIVREYLGPRGMFRRGANFRAVDDVSLQIYPNENVGLVGESGCGKSTFLRTILGLDQVQSGEIRLFGKLFSDDRDHDKRQLRQNVQVVFQDQFGTFDPRWRVHDLIAESFYLFDSPPSAANARKKVDEMLEKVGLRSSDASKFPHEFSGGQRQRVAIARALITEPAVIALDEAVSALDVSIRAQILDLLAELSDRLGMSYLFVTHDLSVARAITDRVLIMKDGRIVEQGKTKEIFANPSHPYTIKLLGSIPDIDTALKLGLSQSTSV